MGLDRVLYRKLKRQRNLQEISLAKMSNNYPSGNLKSNNDWKKIRSFVESKIEIIGLNQEICSRAGNIKQEEIQEFSDFGLMDAIILSTGRKNSLKVITGDKYLKDKEKAKKLE
jgi:predicted nucleic acid-binding protein